MDRQILIKKLIYQSNHRGCKETDFMLGDFANENCEKMNDCELEIYAQLLLEHDWDIYNLVTSGKIDETKYAIFNLGEFLKLKQA